MNLEWQRRIDLGVARHKARKAAQLQPQPLPQTELERVRHLIKCRQQGVWDDPELMEWGYLDVDDDKDVKEMINHSHLTSEQKQDLLSEFIKESSYV